MITAPDFYKWLKVFGITAGGGGGGGVTSWNGFTGVVSAIIDTSTIVNVAPSPRGNDSTGDGTPFLPFASLRAAAASITDSSPANPYVIQFAPGVYTETADSNILIPISTSLKGAGRGVTTINFAIGDFNTILLDPATWIGSTPIRCSISDITFNSANVECGPIDATDVAIYLDLSYFNLFSVQSNIRWVSRNNEYAAFFGGFSFFGSVVSAASGNSIGDKFNTCRCLWGNYTFYDCEASQITAEQSAGLAVINVYVFNSQNISYQADAADSGKANIYLDAISNSTAVAISRLEEGVIKVIPVPVSQVVYFGTMGNSQKSDGSFQFPYPTRIAAVAAVVSLSSESNCYALCQLPGGIIDQGAANIYLYPFLFDINYAPASNITTGFAGIRTTGQILLDSSWGTTANCQYYNYGTNWYADYISLDCQFNTACNAHFENIYWSTTNGVGNNYIKNGLIVHSQDCVINGELRIGDDPPSQDPTSAAFLYDDGSKFNISVYQGLCVSNNFKGDTIYIDPGLLVDSTVRLRITNAQTTTNTPAITAFKDVTSLGTNTVETDGNSWTHNSTIDGDIAFVPLTVDANLVGMVFSFSFGGTGNLLYDAFQYTQINISPTSPGGEVILPDVETNSLIPVSQSRLMTTSDQFTLKDSIGTVLWEFTATTVIRLTLLDNTTPQGTWLIEPLLPTTDNQILTYSTTLGGPIPDTNVDLTVTVVNNRFVTIYLPSVYVLVLTDTSIFTFTPGLPSNLRPAGELKLGFDVIQNDAITRGAIQIQTDGTIYIGLDYGIVPFITATPNAGFPAQTVQYDLLATA